MLYLQAIFFFNCLFLITSENISSSTSITNEPNVEPDTPIIFNENCEALECERKILQTKVDLLYDNLSTCKKTLSAMNSGPISSDYARNCWEIQERGNMKSGVYLIKPTIGIPPFQVYCDMNTLGGGWTYFQHRFNGEVDFYRSYDQYVNGFGSPDGEFWMGLEKLHKLTLGGQDEDVELLIELTDKDGNKLHVRFSKFGIASGSEGYALTHLEGCTPAPQCNSLFHCKAQKFSTYDKDQDSHESNCAKVYHGGWWYSTCHESNLNGKYLVGTTTEFATAMVWKDWKGYNEGMRKTKMMIRPIQ